jgi:vanillate monooxygenase ferredoxin subunit
LKAQGRSFSLRYFARSPSQAAFRGLLSGLDFSEQATCFYDAAADDVRSRLQQLLSSRPPDGHVYACGPRPFMDACVELASCFYPKEAIHLEFFSADQEAFGRPQQTFKVKLVRRSKVIDVPAGVSIIDALARRGIQVDMLCQQGVCGTCLTGVLEGIPDHRDSFLTDDEKHANDKMMICCSRARSPVLILDL